MAASTATQSHRTDTHSIHTASLADKLTLADSKLQSLVPRTNALPIRPQGHMENCCNHNRHACATSQFIAISSCSRPQWHTEPQCRNMGRGFQDRVSGGSMPNGLHAHLRRHQAPSELRSTCGLVATTSASHAGGRQFDPGQVCFATCSGAQCKLLL